MATLVWELTTSSILLGDCVPDNKNMRGISCPALVYNWLYHRIQ